MDIKEFVKETVNGIAQAVYELNEEGFVTVCDVELEKFWQHPTLTKDGKLVKEISFNVCVEVLDHSDNAVGLKLAVVKGGLTSENSNMQRNTIAFSLPVAFLPPKRKKTGQAPKE